MLQDLTPPQAKVFDFIVKQIHERGLPPTVREIGKGCSKSIGTVQDHLAALERKGVLRRTKGARGLIVCVGSESTKTRLPILGRIPAGPAIEAIEYVEDYFEVDSSISRKADFILRVKGTSMEPTFQDGDLVVIESAKTAESGEVVAAAFDDDVTLKKLRKTTTETYLESLNPAYEPLRGKPFSIVGRATSLIRQLSR